MAQREWHAGTEVAIGKLLVIGDIRATDARGLDSNLHFAKGRVLNGPSFLDAVLVNAKTVDDAALLSLRKRVKRTIRLQK